MAKKTDQRVVIENVSEHNLGTEKPLRLMLWSKVKKSGRYEYLSRAVINESQVTPMMETWKGKGWITITPQVEWEKAREEARKKRIEAKAEEDKVENEEKVKMPEGETVTASQEGATIEIKVGADEKTGETITAAVGPAEKTQEPREPKKKEGTKIEAPAEKESTVSSVGSSADGSPNVQEATAKEEDEEEATPEEPKDEEVEKISKMNVDEATEYMNGLKMRDLRDLVDRCGLDVRSTQKEVLIEAIIEATQSNKDQTEEDGQ